ncbi:MAG: DNA polymerase ligase N-terminal domain-containing protein [Candidatus Acidiferrales bacterium]
MGGKVHPQRITLKTRNNAMSLEKYQQKRRFQGTPEPPAEDGRAKRKPSSLIFVVQKHRATQLHYDFRLEWNGVLLSWAVPKGPSLDPAVKRLAMQVEDHPVEYATFEGVIPAGEYGGGTVMVWDKGTWEPEQPDPDEAFKKGDLKFTLRGKKLTGSWVLVRTRGFGGSSGRSSWLLIKHRDRYASRKDIAQQEPFSIVTGRSLEQIARAEGGDVEKAATGDPVLMEKREKAGRRPAKSSRRSP